jgi:hypothetical protein
VFIFHTSHSLGFDDDDDDDDDDEINLTPWRS